MSVYKNFILIYNIICNKNSKLPHAKTFFVQTETDVQNFIKIASFYVNLIATLHTQPKMVEFRLHIEV